MINKLKLKNFKLFKDQEIDFGHLNIITGINFDDSEQSSNGCGKSSILEGIIFAIFGEGSGKNLQDLVSFDSKSTEVELIYDKLDINRKVPTDLTIIHQGVEIQKNTNTLKQEEINKLIGDYSFFKKYRLINKQAINLLDLGLISLRKELMSFISADFSTIRQSLLNKKLERERYSSDKRPYKYYLSKKRKCLLESGHLKLVDIIKDLQLKIDKQLSIMNKLAVEAESNQKQLENCNNRNFKNQLDEWNKEINNYSNLIKELNKIGTITLVDYDISIKKLQEQIEAIQIDIDYLNQEISNKQSENSEINAELSTIKNQSKEAEITICKLEDEIKNIQALNSQSKCDKCGSIIEESKKSIFIKEKEQEVTKEIEIMKQLELNIDSLIKQQNNIREELNKLSLDSKNSKKQLADYQAKLQTLNEQKCNQLKQQEKISLKDADIKKYNDLIERIKGQIEKLRLEEEENKKLSIQLNQNTNDLNVQYFKEKDIIEELGKQQDLLESKEKKTAQYLMKLTEAFKFSDYKYTVKDIEVYNYAIKALDDFSGWFIQRWLNNLAIIINDLLSKVNLSVSFSADKQFLTVVNENRIMKYESLSEGQKTFLNIVFKIAILLNNGITDGIIILDEGVGNLDLINLKKLVEIFKTLQFQIFLIYQNYDLEETDVNLITVMRENGESKIL